MGTWQGLPSSACPARGRFCSPRSDPATAGETLTPTRLPRTIPQREEEMQGDTAPRPSRTNGLAILAASGGIVGLLAGLLLLAATLAGGGLGPPMAVVVLVFSVVELAFAYGTWTQAAWAVTPERRAAGFALAIALIVVGVLIVFLTPVSRSVTPG